MEDTMSEDAMMECSENLDDLVDGLPNLRDAAERLLTLLGVDEADDENDTSEDEGVELDLDDDDDDDDQQSSVFLHELATSLVQELKLQAPSQERMDIEPQLKTNQGAHEINYIALKTRSDNYISNKRCRIDIEEDEASAGGSWAAGWDACAAEAVRYLLEVEGLPPGHPKVISLKSHLQGQRERAFNQIFGGERE